MIQQKPIDNNLYQKPQKIPQQNQAPEYTIQQQQIYHDMMNNWKANQRTSISKRYEYENIYTANPDLPQNHKNHNSTQGSMTDSKVTLFTKYTPEILNYLKCKFVVEEIIQPLEQNKIVDLTQDKVIQFMHLLSFRSWCDINFALHSFQKFSFKSQNGNNQVFVKGKQDKKSIISNPQQQNLKILVGPMFKLALKAQKALSFYHKSLSFRQSSFKYRLKSFYNFIFNNSKKTSRDKILFGVQGLDFMRDQQIQYTEDNCVQYMRKYLIDYAGEKPLKMRNLIKAYSKIMKIQVHKLESFDGFQTLKNTIIKQQQIRFNVKPTLT